MAESARLGKIPVRGPTQAPEVRVHEHQVLLLQQLQPLATTPLLHGVPKVLDTWRCTEECPSWWQLPEEQEEEQKWQIKISD
ncbi:hypothetical protein Nepgr_014634 [Nepenthes gracilis]|uniref:Uncharacterized protein n=1 Tax=Nepenthes gracilis TaxID=150966 RepID=A0AAD3XQ14_NEPGR|nr:hypothetical protein Nepgr_014634 [Nepenthes gracilis]